MTTMIVGGKGYIAGKLSPAFPDAVMPDVDIADRLAVAEALDTHRPSVVINAAGKTGRPNVDWCEDHKRETLHSNVTGPLVLMEECLARGVYLVHIGSGCVYDGYPGGDGYTEDDPPNFQGSFYSFSKFMSEALLKPFPVLQLRLRMPFDGVPDPRNLLTKLSRYPKVLDAENSLTYIPDLVRITTALIERRATGIYNVTNPGAVSPYRVMERYRELVDSSHSCERISLADLPAVTKAPRSNCILSSLKLEKEGLPMTAVDVALEEALLVYRKAKKKL